VVNEAIEPKDGLANGLRKSPWLELIGPDYIELAFRTAAEADPHANLPITTTTLSRIRPGRRKSGRRCWHCCAGSSPGVPIHAVGVQSHLPADGDQPGAGLQSFIREAAKMGLEVYVTEMDVKFHGQNATQTEEDAAVAAVYRNYLNLVLAEPNVPNVLTWGITDAHTWLTHLNHEAPGTAPAIRQRPMPFDDLYSLGEVVWRGHPNASGCPHLLVLRVACHVPGGFDLRCVESVRDNARVAARSIV